jgi:hypothetical protein
VGSTSGRRQTVQTSEIADFRFWTGKVAVKAACRDFY